jgi:uncharacterized protein (DUF58 family)
MGNFLFLFMMVLIILAALFRADFVLIILYLMAGAFVISHWWSRRAASALLVERELPERVFFGEKVNVRVTADNTGYLPMVWAHLRETLPMELAAEGVTEEVVYLGAKGRAQLNYRLDCRKRGYYPIGPLTIFSGDILGIGKQQTSNAPADHLTVFPKIIPLSSLQLPTHSPLGTLRHTTPIFEDPARVRGKRDYITGDSLRRVDWKATANARRLQVKLFEPSIALETLIFLNLNRAEIDIKDLYRASELGIEVAASLANWVTRARQAVGLATNGVDPLLAGGAAPVSMSPRRGQGNLMHILDLLARVQTGDTFPLVQLIQQEAVHLAWGSSLIVITNQAGDELFDALFQARRKGLETTLVLCGFVEKLNEIQNKALYFRFQTVHLMTEQDLDIWKG